MRLDVFLASFGLIGAAFGFTLGTATEQLIRSIVHNIFVPILSIFFDRNKLINLDVKFLGINFGIGNFIISLITFLFTILIVYFLLNGLFNDLLTKVKENKEENDIKNLKQNESIVQLLQRLNANIEHHHPLLP